MLNEIVRRLNGHGEDPQSLEEALKLLADQKAAARAALKDLHERRRQALLDDASDAALDKLEREIERGETRIEKLTIAEPSLRARLSAAQAAARQRRWSSHRETYCAAAAEFLTAARAAATRHTALVAIVEQAQREGFSREVAAAMPVTPNIAGHALLAVDLLDSFELAVAGHSASSQARVPVKAPASPTRPAARTVLPHERQKLTDSQRQVSLSLAQEARERAPRPADDLAPLEPGEARVKVLRSGFSPSEDRPQTSYGQVARMPRGAAERAANTGAVEILEIFGDTSSSLTIIGKGEPGAAGNVTGE
jgi:hypothetical protein